LLRGAARLTILGKLVRNLFRPRGRQTIGTDEAADRAAAVTFQDGPGGTCAEILQRAAAAAAAGRLDTALKLYRAAMTAYPQALDACLGAAGVLVDLWSIEEAVATYERALQLAPASSAVFSALLFHQHYLPAVDAQAMFELHRRYGAMMRETVPRPHAYHAQSPDAGRRLRIGYISPNFSRHSVGYFIEPVIRCHDRQQYEVFCYYAHRLADDTTRRIRALADGWRDVAGADEEAVANRVRDDRIDILFDLAGHSKGNQLGVFARRPAPLQVTWLGYPDTTGLAAIDYRITDAAVDPAPAADARNTEQLLRIDDCFLCYQPPADAPPVAAREPGPPVVFASFNTLAKVNAETIRTWGGILAAIPESRLVIKAAALDFPDTVERLLDNCERGGIDPARIELRGWAADRRRHLEHYGGIDIALDTFPYNGTTTTCEALWMGVPVITLAGEMHMSRVGATLLRGLGLADLVARDAAEYANIAIALAADSARLKSLRATLRSRLLASPLLDHAGFTKKLEAHCRRVWATWCGRQGGA
jgi:predicted O-linked N-acetylglucosamine transferase (SPINDLY family)